MMEQLNRVQLRGIIGTVRTTNISGSLCARFSVATNYAYKAKDGTAVIETTWHNVSAFSSDKSCDLSSLSKGDKVEVTGRITNQRYVGEDGVDRTCCEVRASSVRKIETDEPLNLEM